MAMARETTPIESVLLVDPLESFPLGWRQVLALLPNVVLWQPEPQGQDQLRQVQERALGTLRDGKVQALDAPVTDGSVLLVRASTREVAEQWLSASCRSAAIDRLLLCEGGGDSLDATMMATGAAGSGFPHLSALRPPLQAVGLALEMCWAPIDVGRLIEFLSHPVGPFSRKARLRLPGWWTNSQVLAVRRGRRSNARLRKMTEERHFLRTLSSGLRVNAGPGT